MIRHLSLLTRKATGRFVPSERVPSPKSIDDVSRPPACAVPVPLVLGEPLMPLPSACGTRRAARDLTVGDEVSIHGRWVAVTAVELDARWDARSGKGLRIVRLSLADGHQLTRDFQSLVLSRDAVEQAVAAKEAAK